MGKKKFLDKKKSATFQLFARDSADPNYDPQVPSSDRVFVRVDKNSYPVPGFADEYEDDAPSATHLADDPDSIFADAQEDEDEVEDQANLKPFRSSVYSLPDNIRREILELGLPDDGYNYLLHLREIKYSGGGSAYYENSKANLDQLPSDVKAYDASRVPVPLSVTGDDSNDNVIYSVAAKSIGVKVQKAVDPEVAALLDDSDFSRFDSDIEDLEEDFVVQANLRTDGKEGNEHKVSAGHAVTSDNDNRLLESISHQLNEESECVNEKPRARRLLDEQFDMLTLQEYGTESDSDHDGFVVAEDECLADKLNHVLKDHAKGDLELDDMYRVPADLLHENGGSNDGEVVESAAEIIRRCAEYAKMYDDENQNNDEVVILEESSDEAEVWDCETIVSTYSNLDNHPGKIESPWATRKKKLVETISAVSGVGGDVISLRGKGLPVDYLPQRKKHVLDKVNETPGSISNQPKRRPHGVESKEEKKERKTAVKEERREARKAKKELKGIYRCEAQRAQKVAAVSGPSAIHLM